ncbi:MAG: hypothetical protein Q4G34_08000 [Micrococcus sp.]|nr:hypothetical protein [Micrococcus sp.]
MREKSVDRAKGVPWGWIVAVGFAVVAGAVMATLIPPLVWDEAFRLRFLTSAGFGGIMAVMAAGIAFGAAWLSATAAGRQARADREERRRATLKDQWWERAQWAMDQVVAGDRQVGFEVLAALADSEWADQHEGDLIAAVAVDATSAQEVVHLDNPSNKQDTGKHGKECEDDSGRSTRRGLANRFRRWSG